MRDALCEKVLVMSGGLFSSYCNISASIILPKRLVMVMVVIILFRSLRSVTTFLVSIIDLKVKSINSKHLFNYVLKPCNIFFRWRDVCEGCSPV